MAQEMPAFTETPRRAGSAAGMTAAALVARKQLISASKEPLARRRRSTGVAR